MEEDRMDRGQFQKAVQEEELPILAEGVPVVMPELPMRLTISTEQQFKAISDLVRSRILGAIQYQPLTAKQIAQRLQGTPGAVGHHLRVLEEAGMVRVVARRLIHGIVASYYTRSARIFDYQLSAEVQGTVANLDIAYKVHAELLESVVSYEDDPLRCDGFPHARLSPERIKHYQERFFHVIDEMVAESPDPDGEVYGIFFGIFKSPPYMQVLDKAEDGEQA